MQKTNSQNSKNEIRNAESCILSNYNALIDGFPVYQHQKIYMYKQKQIISLTDLINGLFFKMKYILMNHIFQDKM